MPEGTTLLVVSQAGINRYLPRDTKLGLQSSPEQILENEKVPFKYISLDSA